MTELLKKVTAASSRERRLTPGGTVTFLQVELRQQLRDSRGVHRKHFTKVCGDCRADRRLPIVVCDAFADGPILAPYAN